MKLNVLTTQNNLNQFTILNKMSFPYIYEPMLEKYIW